ncbi:MAG: transglycosylase SLT domain-containing protein [Polyangiales bacterium]
MRIALLVIGVIFLGAWHSRSGAGPLLSAVRPAESAAAVDYRYWVGEHPSSAALARAIDARLTVRANPEGESIYVQHCRVSPGGCRARIATLSRLITEASNRAGVDPFLTAGIAMRESGLNPLAVSPVGARGVVQLNPKYRGKTVPFVYNAQYREKCSLRPGACQREVLDAGLGLYRWAVSRCGGDVQKGLSWYNSGRCDKQNGYASSVLQERRRLLQLAKESNRAVQTALND